MKISHIAAIVLSATVTAVNAYAQKQPQIQQGGVRAPENIKIDGKLTEWPDVNLNAFNPSDRIFYVVSNDDNNLYFTIRGKGNGVARKDLSGGMVITITKANDKKKDNITLAYPLPQDNKTAGLIMATINQLIDYTDNPVANKKQIDSIVTIGNHLLDNSVKEVGVSGIKEISEPVISMYNEYGIKAVMQFIKMQPIIELAIPLKYLGLSVNDAAIIKYNIKLNKIPEELGQFAAPTVTDANGNAVATSVNPDVGFAFNSTDFWGEYVLVKKP